MYESVVSEWLTGGWENGGIDEDVIVGLKLADGWEYGNMDEDAVSEWIIL